MSQPVLPAELCDEIISYLRNDSKSLKACSLANKVMTVPCQKRLFHRIALQQHYIRHKSDSDRQSAKFFQLLTGSPHISGYVRSLFIYDRLTFIHDGPLDSESGDPLDAPMVAYTEPENYLREHWLPQDKYLPHFAPLLCNLRALTISYNGKWRHLSFRVFSSLVHIMQLPSLLYLRLECSTPDCIFDLAMGENVKHLSMDYGYDEPFPVHQLSHLPSGPLGPVYIESLSTSSSQVLNFLRRSTRIRTHCLRKVVLSTKEPITQAFLESCDALEDLKVITNHDCTLDPKGCSLLTYLIIPVPAPSIDFGKLTTMARFTASLGFAREFLDGTLKTNMPWLCQVLQSGSTLANQALREITIGVSCYYGKDYYSIWEWEEIFDILDRYSNLAVLNITITTQNACGGHAGEILFDLLDDCDGVRRLRTEKDVDVRGEHDL